MNRQQQITLAILPKISSTLSIGGSFLILAECFYFDAQHRRLKRVYNRLLCSMAVFDILESIWNFLSTWPIPKQSEEGLGIGSTGMAAPAEETQESSFASVAFASGNHQSCQAQGFFLQFGLALPILNACLSLYYLLVIRYSWSEERIKRTVEPWFYAVSILVAFGTAFAGLFLDLYHDSGLWCWIAASNSGDNHYQFYRYAFYFIPLFLCFLIIVACMGLLSWTVCRLERASKKYLASSYVKKCRNSTVSRKSILDPNRSPYSQPVQENKQEQKQLRALRRKERNERFTSTMRSFTGTITHTFRSYSVERSSSGSLLPSSFVRYGFAGGYASAAAVDAAIATEYRNNDHHRFSGDHAAASSRHDEEKHQQITSAPSRKVHRRESFIKRGVVMIQKSAIKLAARKKDNSLNNADLDRILALKHGKIITRSGDRPFPNAGVTDKRKEPSSFPIPILENSTDADSGQNDQQPLHEESLVLTSAHTSKSLSMANNIVSDNKRNTDAHTGGGAHVNDEKDNDREENATANVLSSTTLRPSGSSTQNQSTSFNKRSMLYAKSQPKKSKSKQVTEQALFYVLAFVLTFIWSFLNRFFVLSGNNAPYILQVGNAFFDPLQGFINFLVYIRPKLISYRKKFPLATRFQRFKAIVSHQDILHDEDKEVEECAKKELLEWRNINVNLSPV